MSRRECTISGCTTKTYGHGWCEKHYTRWRRNGDPEVVQRYTDPADALAARTERRGGCIVWTGALNTGGYGIIRVNGETRMAHRIAWQEVRGAIPPGLFLDHTCWNRACVNVEHLRIVTRQQNNSYLSGSQGGRDLPRNVSRYRGGYVVRVRKNGHQNYFGTYSSLAEATRVAEAKREELFGIYAGR